MVNIKDIYRNPVFFHILVPIVVALWPLLVWGVYLPRAQKNWDDEQKQYKKARQIMTKILELDSQRLELAGSNKGATQFDYAIAVEQVASQLKIPSTNYNLSSGMVMALKGQKSQRAKVDLKNVSIKTCAEFLSRIQLSWANLQCLNIRLTKKEGLPDMWDVDLNLKYYY